MAVTGLPHAYACCLIGGQRYVFVDVPRDDDYIERLIEVETEFWEAVQARRVPEPNVDLSDTLEAIERYTREFGPLPSTGVRHPAKKSLPAEAGGWSSGLVV
jgi:predicted phage-related endonuclease